MKYLTEYIEQEQSDLFKRLGAFFAFSNEQFNEQKKEETKYVSLKHGLICPIDNVDELLNGMKQIHKKAIERDLEENGKSKIIIRELYNHECFYTADYQELVPLLKPYGFTLQDIYKEYCEELNNID